MKAGEAFGAGAGGGCGLMVGILLALVLIPVVTIIGCGVLGGGCVLLGSAAKKASDAAERARQQQMHKENNPAEIKTPLPENKSDDTPHATESIIKTDGSLTQGNTPPPEPAEHETKDKPELQITESASEPSPQESAMHTWTDASGDHTIEAEFQSMANGKVKLKKADGSIITISLDKLSDEDQRLIRKRGR